MAMAATSPARTPDGCVPHRFLPFAEARAYGRDERDEALRFYEAARSLFLDDGVSRVAA